MRLGLYNAKDMEKLEEQLASLFENNIKSIMNHCGPDIEQVCSACSQFTRDYVFFKIQAVYVSMIKENNLYHLPILLN